MDLSMQSRMGKSLLRNCKKIDPDVRILLSCGYAIDNRAKPILDGGRKGFIQ